MFLWNIVFASVLSHFLIPEVKPVLPSYPFLTCSNKLDCYTFTIRFRAQPPALLICGQHRSHCTDLLVWCGWHKHFSSTVLSWCLCAPALCRPAWVGIYNLSVLALVGLNSALMQNLIRIVSEAFYPSVSEIQFTWGIMCLRGKSFSSNVACFCCWRVLCR